MSKQQTFFELGINDPFNGTKHPTRTCTPARIGSGPDGETCGTCRHRVHVKYARPYQKCGLMRSHWTNGKATDIKAAWAACRCWEAAEKSHAVSGGNEGVTG